MISTASSALGHFRETNAFAPGHQVLLEERAEVGPRAGRLGDVRAADRVGGAGLVDRVLEAHLDPVLVELGDDLLRAVDALLLGAVAGGLDRLEVDPVAADVQVLGVLVDAGHLGRRHVLDAELVRRRESPPATPATPSWSVSDITSTPASAAERTTSPGSSWPSETVEWDCRSIIGSRASLLAQCEIA